MIPDKDDELAELIALREICAGQIADGLDAHSLAAIMRQLVQVSATIDDRTKPDGEDWISWLARRYADAPRGVSDAAYAEWRAAWLAVNPEPPRPQRRDTPHPLTDHEGPSDAT